MTAREGERPAAAAGVEGGAAPRVAVAAAGAAVAPAALPAVPPGGALLARAARRLRRDRVGMASLVVVLAYALLAALVLLGVAGHDWASVDDGNRYAPASPAHPLGTNQIGQDILARAMFSTRTAFEIGIAVAFGTTLLGALLGGLAGFYAGSLLDETVLWLKGVLDSIPFYLFVAAIAFALGDWPYAMHAAMISTFWTSTGRLVRGEVVKLRQLEFVEAARALGVPGPMVLLRHVLPNTLHILLVQSTLVFVAAIKSEVILSFLGLGVKNGVSWGLMIAESANEVMRGELGNFLAASLFMFGLVLAFSLLADSLQDAVDPRHADGGR